MGATVLFLQNLARQLKLYMPAITKAAFILAIITLTLYQIQYLFQVTPAAPFQEPDNYEYYLFAQIAIRDNSFLISNPYLVYPVVGFFEHPGLLTLPVILHGLIPSVPLYWDFRIIYAIPIFTIYLMLLLITKVVLDNLTINRSYKYVAYTLVILNSLLLQQTEIIEWRGTAFTTAITLIMFYIVCYIYSKKNLQLRIKLIMASSLVGWLFLAWYTWSGWAVTLGVLLLFPAFEIYKRIKGKRLYWFLALLMVITGLAIGGFSQQIDVLIINGLQRISSGGVLGGSLNAIQGINCFNNPIQLGEVGCLTPSVGLYAVVAFIIFFAFIIRVFLANPIFSINRDKYEFFVVGAIFMTFLYLPFAMIYLRLIQLIAPFLAFGFAVGVAALFTRNDVNRVIQVCIIFVVLFASFGAVVLWMQTTDYIIHLNNPPGLIGVADYLNSSVPPNSVVLSFYGYADYLQDVGHVKVYTNTIQEINYTRIIAQNKFYSSYPINCTYLSELSPSPAYIMTSNTLVEFGIFQGVSSYSLVNDSSRQSFCNYTQIYQNQGFYLFQKDS